MFTRKIGKLLRGKATTPQIMMAAILGGLLGFVPGFVMVGDLGGGFMQAPGLILTLSFLVFVLNANMVVFGITAFAAKLVSLLVMPVSFGAGRLLLDGPTQGLFKGMINAPVLAWFGLEYYATTGGLLVGAIFGSVTGWLFLRMIRTFRSRMASTEEGSERYQKLTGKRTVRFLTWVFLGKGKGKRSYRELLESHKKGLPVRIPGIAVVGVACIGLWLCHGFLSGPALRNALQLGLEKWNGATVDLARAEVDFTQSQVLLEGLAMADPDDLSRDSFRAELLELSLGTRDVLQKRLVFESVISREASTGAPRQTPGMLVTSPPPPPPPPPGPGATLDDYLKEAEKWKSRLEQVSRWLAYLVPGEDAEEESAPEALELRLERAASEHGLSRVTASHLIEGAPRVLVRELAFDGVTSVDLRGDLLDIRARNLSTDPHLVTDPLVVSIAARSGVFSFRFEVDASTNRAAKTEFTYKGLSVDEVAGQLADPPIRGGTMDVSLAGSLDCSRPEGVWIDMPLQVRLHDTILSLKGMKEAKIDHLTVPLGLRGPLSSPRVHVDDGALADALVAAGKRELAGQLRSRAGALLGERMPGVGNELGQILDGKALEETVAENEVVQETKARVEKKVEEEIGEKANEALGGLLPGGLFGGSKATPKPSEDLYGRWTRSSEEDEGSVEVYRLAAAPDTGAGFQVHRDGTFVLYKATDTGEPERQAGRWKALAEDRIRVDFPAGSGTSFTLHILQVDREILKIRR